MKTLNREKLGHALICDHVNVILYRGGSPSPTAAEYRDGELTMGRKLSNRALVNMAAGYVSVRWREEILELSEPDDVNWRCNGTIDVGLSRWRIKIVNSIEGKSGFFVYTSIREIRVLRDTADKMIPAAMVGVDLAWKLWRSSALKGALQGMPEALSASECASFQKDWEGARAKIEGEAA